ncbi:MAG: cytochrome P460 family protein [Hyphomicrobiaceae bacterium]
MPRHRLLCCLSALLLSVAVAADAAQPAKVGYPATYRKWDHVRSMVIAAGHPLYETFGGIHHIYANRRAMKGFATGTFPEGAVLVLDLLAVDETPDHALNEGARKLVAVMQKDAKRFAATGGWGFEAFRAGTRERIAGPEGAAACFACHAGRQKSDYVFSSFRP